ncbi:MAG TPA: hypothetical protein VFZ25_05765 [Chloroflexota bacterium]|nr:hypothetical protein [Chloroflexota bacterium]
MPNHEIFRAADSQALKTLPQLTEADRAVLEQLLRLAPDVAVSTAAAVIRQHQPDLHELIFRKGPEPASADVAPLARGLIYLGLAIAAPGQGKLLPTLNRERIQRALGQVRVRLALWGQAALSDGLVSVEADAVPDPELRRVLDALVERVSQPTGRDPRWIRAVAYSEAGAFYQALAEACAEQFAQAVDLSVVSGHLQRVARTRELITDALSTEDASRRFSPARQEDYLERLRRFGWQEFTASRGRTLPAIAAEGAALGITSTTTFALSDEWSEHGASIPTTGRRYFIRPTLLPDSGGLALWAQEERLKPLQKMLAGDPNETGLRLTLGTAEVLLEFAVRGGHHDYLRGQWTRVRNRYAGLQTRLGFPGPDRYAITLFPSSRLDEQVGVCPVIEVEQE